MDASKECITALRFRMHMDLDLMGNDERSKNICGNIDKHTKKRLYR